MKINKTTKRLLSAMQIGVGFDSQNGHRWITWYEVGDRLTLKERLDQEKIYPDVKVYGNIIDCLNYIDYLCKLVGWKTLEEQFDEYQDWAFGADVDINWENDCYYEGEDGRKEWERMNSQPSWLKKSP